MRRLGISLLAVLAAAATSGSIAQEGARNEMQPSSQQTADRLAKTQLRAAERYQAVLPQYVDVSTTLTEVTASGDLLTYAYVMDKHFPLKADFIKHVQLEAVKRICDSEMKALAVGARYRFIYRDSDNRELGTFFVTETDCRAR